jgi:hypothetical protein
MSVYVDPMMPCPINQSTSQPVNGCAMIRCPQCGHHFDESPAAQLAEAVAAQETPYPFRVRYKWPAAHGSVSECQVLNLANCWNTHVTRITVLNQERMRAIVGRLVDGYKWSDCRDAVVAYGRDAWHRNKASTGHPAWLDLTDFFTVANLERWLRPAQDAAAKREHNRPPAPAVQGLVKPLAEALRIPTLADEERAVLERFKTRPAEEQERVIAQAVEELRTIRPSIRFNITLESHAVRQQVLVILRRGRQP